MALLIIFSLSFTLDKRSREVLLERLKRTLNPARKDSEVDNVDAVFANTFGLPIEECPFSDDNKVC